jgi:hypothetical protein
MRKVLPETETVWTVRRTFEDELLGVHVTTPLDETVKVVCSRCNSGWMNQLEANARAPLTSMIRGQQTELTPDDQRAVAAWVAMTMLMYRFRPPVEPYSQLAEPTAWLFSHKEPALDTLIGLGMYADPTASMFTLFHTVTAREAEGPGRAKISALVVGHLLVQTVEGTVGDGIDFPNNLLSVWPPSALTLPWPPAQRVYVRQLAQQLSIRTEEGMVFHRRAGERVPWPADRTLRDRTVRIAEWVRDDQAIENVTFERCWILGPAVVAILPPVEVDSCMFMDARETTLLEVDPSQPIPVGCLVLRSCRFRSCWFDRITIAGPGQILHQIADAVAGW